MNNKLEIIRGYQKCAVQERAAWGDFQSAVRQLHNQNVQGLRHYLTEGTVLADKERFGEFKRVQKHLNDLKKQVVSLDECLSKNDPEALRSLLLITKTNLQDARAGWEQAAAGLDAREQALKGEIDAALARQKALVQVQQNKKSGGELDTLSLGEANAALGMSKSSRQGGVQPVRVAARLNLPEPLRLIEEELAHIGAPYGGWEADSHALFYHQFVQVCIEGGGNQRVFLQQIARKFPLLQQPQLQRHAEFCTKLYELLRRKQALIAQLRARRVAALQEQQEQQDKEDMTVHKPARQGLSEEERQRITERKAEKARQEAEKARALELQKREEILRLKEAKKRAEEAAERRAEKQRQKDAERALKDEEIVGYTGLKGVDAQRVKQQEKERREADIQKAREKAARKKALEEQLRQHEEQLRQLAKACAPAAPQRDQNSLMVPTKAQLARAQEVSEARAQGKTLGAVTTGFDPFAVVPIGGFQRAAWM